MKWSVAVLLVLTIPYVALETGYYLGKNSTSRTYDYTKLPNSCFLEALIHASRANLVLKTDVNPNVYSSIFGYTFRHKDDILINGKKSALIMGHAICVFEYKNKLWVYDMNHGTMYVGISGDRKSYAEVLKEWAERTYRIDIEKCFVVDDWALPIDVTDY